MSLADIVLNIILGLLTTVVGILVVLWIERQRRPSLTMSVGEPGHILETDPLRRQVGTWLHVQVHNRNVPKWLAWVYRGEPALGCRAWITFHHLDGHRVFDREMVVRWSESDEPRTEVLAGQGVQAVRLVGVQDAFDIPPGEYTNLDVVFRAKDETNCYGWNNESYLHNWRNPAWCLEKGRYIAQVRVKSGGQEYRGAFLIANDVAYEDFRLVPLDTESKRRLK